MSTDVCEGCRRLRRKCETNCVLRPCLDTLWPCNRVAQGNATHFLAKSYGRRKFNRLLDEVEPIDRPELLRSLLLESCARLVNPVRGIYGLLQSMTMNECHSVVSAILNGNHQDQAFSATHSPSTETDEKSVAAAPVAPSPRPREPPAFERIRKRVKREKDELPRLVPEPQERVQWLQPLNLDLNLSLY